MGYYRDLDDLGKGEYLRAFFKHDYYKGNKKITKNDYLNYVRRRLKRSFYPRQINDFFFMRMPKILSKYKDYTEKEIPVDWLLAPIVKYFWDKGIMTVNLDQGFRNYSGTDPHYDLDCVIRLFYSKKALEIVNKMGVKFEKEGKYIVISFPQVELPRIYKILGVEIPDINKAYRGGILWQEFSKNKKLFKYMNLEDDFTEMVEYPDFFEWYGNYY